jgi:Transposase DDE domain group 1
MGKRFRDCNLNQQLLMPVSLHDWLPEGYLARFVAEVVEAVDLSAIYAKYEQGDGRGLAADDPRMMVRLLIYGYCRGVASSRQMEPLEVAHRAFAALPDTVKEYYYRGDSACHESELVNWLRNEKREGGPQGKIGFAISARMSEALHAAIETVPEPEWKAYGESHPAEIRECAEVPFVPGEKTEKKDTQPLRYVAIRIRNKQSELFEDGSRVRHFAVLTNRWELSPARLIEWHGEKAGTVEMVHDVVKNELGGGVLPSKYFGANAAWLRLAVIAHNVLTALKRLALPAELVTARPKRLRFLIFNVPGRLVHHARRLMLRLAATAEWLTRYREALQLLPLKT